MTKSRKACVVEALKALGYRPTFSRTSRLYDVWIRDAAEGPLARQILIGRSAVRIVRSDEPLTQSVSLTDLRIHEALASVGRQVGGQVGMTGEERRESALRRLREQFMGASANRYFLTPLNVREHIIVSGQAYAWEI